ncbi:hypothetical protein JB92DRAFT_2895013 [Gautieria morchelliformis]|nr:hypothetical protein JB92DRAFT_2895013 [Gautieria morchelliformis]
MPRIKASVQRRLKNRCLYRVCRANFMNQMVLLLTLQVVQIPWKLRTMYLPRVLVTQTRTQVSFVVLPVICTVTAPLHSLHQWNHSLMNSKLEMRQNSLNSHTGCKLP